MLFVSSIFDLCQGRKYNLTKKLNHGRNHMFYMFTESENMFLVIKIFVTNCFKGTHHLVLAQDLLET